MESIGGMGTNFRRKDFWYRLGRQELGCVRLTLFRNKNNRNKPEQPFDWDAIPIPEYMECIPNILLQRAEYLE